jgi:Zn-dependent M16 (insulinase) family peptidase
MSLLHRLKPKWFTGVDPFDSLAWNDTLAAFEKEFAKGGYLEGLMEKYLMNDNTLTFTMAPSAKFVQELAKEEEARLQTRISKAIETAGGEEQARAALEARELALLVEQGKSNTEDLSCLPSVHVQDIPRQKEPVVLRSESVGEVKLQLREAPTNGLTYFRAINTLENLPDELRSLIPLFTDSIMRLGTKDMTMEQLEDLIKLKTGGVSVSYHSASQPTDFTQAKEGLAFSGMALDRNVPIMFDLLRKLIVETNFDSPEAAQQIRQLLQAASDGVVNDIASSGHAYARRAAEAGLTWDAFVREQVSGLSQVKLVTSLANRPESDRLEDVIGKLKLIQQFAFAGTMRAAITCDSESVANNTGALAKFLDSLPSNTANFPARKNRDFTRNIKSFYPLPYQVYYGALALPTVSYTSPDNAPLQILSSLLTHKHLHHEIREKGGAYGGGAYSRAIDGIFGFYSYRDPNPLNTIKIMQNAGQWAVDKKWSDRDLEDAKISVFQGVDAPRAVNEEGMSNFVYGVTDEMKQTRREQLLDVTKDQVREVAQKYIVNSLGKQAERLVFLGEKRDFVDNSWTINEMDINGSA